MKNLLLMPTNARFITEPSLTTAGILTDFHDGPRYLHEGHWLRLNFHTTFDELERLPFVRRTQHHQFDWPVHRFEVPVRLGIFEYEGLEINAIEWPQARTDVPIDHIGFMARFVERGDENYRRLEVYLKEFLGEPLYGWERRDSLHADWVLDGIKYSLTYWYKSDYAEESGYASLSIENERIYPKWLTDAYTLEVLPQLRRLDLKTFQRSHLTLPQRYRSSHHVRLTPQRVQAQLAAAQADFAIWLDSPNDRLGFAKSDYALVVPFSSIVQTSLDTIDRDRGQYDAEISLHFAAGYEEVAVRSGRGELDDIFEILVEWTGLKSAKRDF